MKIFIQTYGNLLFQMSHNMFLVRIFSILTTHLHLCKILL